MEAQCAMTTSASIGSLANPGIFAGQSVKSKSLRSKQREYGTDYSDLLTMGSTYTDGGGFTVTNTGAQNLSNCYTLTSAMNMK